MPKIKQFDADTFVFFCEGCQETHGFKSTWSFNGDFDKPTFSPSLLIRSGHYVPNTSGPCWCKYNKENPNKQVPYKCGVCHSFVTDGKIRYLNDCTHDLAGKIIEIPEVDTWF